MSDWLEIFWGEILSEDAGRVRKAFAPLPAEEKTAVYAHLKRMTTETGWTTGQREAAQAALNVLDSNPPSTAETPNGSPEMT